MGTTTDMTSLNQKIEDVRLELKSDIIALGTTVATKTQVDALEQRLTSRMDSMENRMATKDDLRQLTDKVESMDQDLRGILGHLEQSVGEILRKLDNP